MASFRYGTNHCAHCGKTAAYSCAGCQQMWYCSRECQRIHWAYHNKDCPELPSSLHEPKVVNYCANCSRVASKRCAGCGLMWYCTKSCQISHWPVHEKRCVERENISMVTMSQMLLPFEEFERLFNDQFEVDCKPCGLSNTNNNCFLNVVIQCLCFTPPFAAYFNDKDHKSQCIIRQRGKLCFLCEIQSHVEKARNNDDPYPPSKIIDWSLENSEFGNGEHHDANEYFEFVKARMEGLESTTPGDADADCDRIASLFQHAFGGFLRLKNKCERCNLIFKEEDQYFGFTPVPIPKEATRLDDCVDKYFKADAASVTCARCGESDTHSTSVLHPPNILTLVLSRFEIGSTREKNYQSIQIPEDLDISSYLTRSNETARYQLYAVVVHTNSTHDVNSGHYFYFVKAFDGIWYKISDENVVEVNVDTALSQTDEAYMLFYKRTPSPQLSCRLTAEAVQACKNSALPEVSREPEQRSTDDLEQLQNLNKNLIKNVSKLRRSRR